MPLHVISGRPPCRSGEVVVKIDDLQVLLAEVWTAPEALSIPTWKLLMMARKEKEVSEEAPA